MDSGRIMKELRELQEGVKNVSFLRLALRNAGWVCHRMSRATRFLHSVVMIIKKESPSMRWDAELLAGKSKILFDQEQGA